MPTSGLTRGADRLTLAFEGLLTRTEGNPWLGFVAVLAALALGAGHAVAPGHGKTIMAFYLSGRREGALRSAATVGATVTVTHTAGVLLLGLLVSAGTAFVPARVYPWLSVVSGLLVVAGRPDPAARVAPAAAPGALRRHPQPRPPRHTHAHTHTPHPPPPSPPLIMHHWGSWSARAPGPAGTHSSAAVDHAPVGILVRTDTEHEHGQAPARPHVTGTRTSTHGHAHPHPHVPAEAEATSRRGLIAIGLAGGLLPSPSALLVLLGAIALGHAWFGVALVVAFGLGMAVTLAVVGLVVMRLRERAELRLRSHPASRFAPLLRIAPPLTAVAVVLLGAALAWRGFGATGLL